MLMNIERELSRTIPNDLPSYYLRHGETAFTAYGCIILERCDGNCFTYTAINLNTGKHEVISRQRNPLKQSGVPAMLDKIRHSSVSGAAWYEIDRNFGETISLNKCLEILEVTFREVLPQFGYPINREQISLSREILESISRRKTIHTKAEDSLETTFAYLTVAVLAKRGRLNGFWNMGLYADVPYIKLPHMPIVIATSNLERQKALCRDFIPILSKALLKSGIIKTPLTIMLNNPSQSSEIDIQIVSHNFLLADAQRRSNNQPPIIPNYQILIIEEAHRLLPAARNVYSLELSCKSVLDLAKRIKRFRLKMKDSSLHRMVNNLSQKCLWLFEHLSESTEPFAITPHGITSWYINSILNTSNRIIDTLFSETISGFCGSSKTKAIRELRNLRDHAETLSRHDERIFWLEKSNTDKTATPSPKDMRLLSIPKDLGKRLHDNIWSKGVPTVIIGGIPNLGIPFEQ